MEVVFRVEKSKRTNKDNISLFRSTVWFKVTAVNFICCNLCWLVYMWQDLRELTNVHFDKDQICMQVDRLATQRKSTQVLLLTLSTEWQQAGIEIAFLACTWVRLAMQSVVFESYKLCPNASFAIFGHLWQYSEIIGSSSDIFCTVWKLLEHLWQSLEMVGTSLVDLTQKSWQI